MRFTLILGNLFFLPIILEEIDCGFAEFSIINGQVVVS